jgi:hypothetical protein
MKKKQADSPPPVFTVLESVSGPRERLSAQIDALQLVQLEKLSAHVYAVQLSVARLHGAVTSLNAAVSQVLVRDEALSRPQLVLRNWMGRVAQWFGR